MKAEKECERKNERANKQVSKNNKKTGFSQTKNNISNFSLKNKETQIRDKPKHREEAKQKVKLT